MYRDKDKLAINVAKLYYRSDYSQQKIAQELGVSRPSISRLLQYAKDKGYVNIQIVDPVEDMSHMEQRLKDKLHLKDVKIASSTINDEEEIKKYIGITAARYLDSIIKAVDKLKKILIGCIPVEPELSTCKLAKLLIEPYLVGQNAYCLFIVVLFLQPFTVTLPCKALQSGIVHLPASCREICVKDDFMCKPAVISVPFYLIICPPGLTLHPVDTALKLLPFSLFFRTYFLVCHVVVKLCVIF